MAVVAVDIGGTKLLVSVVDSGGEIIFKFRNNTPKSADDLVNLVIDSVNEASGRSAEKVTGVGLAVAGLVDHKSGLVVSSPNLPLTGIDLRGRIAARIDLPVFIDNDGNLAALGEWFKGSGRKLTDFVALTLGTGIGGGIFMGGRLYRGYFGTAAEVGHMIIEIDGPKCGCGRRGCFEAMASGTAVARMALERASAKPRSALAAALSGQSSDRLARIVEGLAQKSDLDSVNIFDEMGRALGVGLGNLINIFSPQGIIIGGGMANASGLFLSKARAAMIETAIDPRADQVVVGISTLANDAGLYGAAALAGLKIAGDVNV